jgi:hypothetical protein
MVCVKKSTTLISLLLIFYKGWSQFTINPPAVNDAAHPISDTIYMSPSGNDGNPGTLTKPVRSFSKAMSLLPFGTVGIQNGHAFGLIMMLPGQYETNTGFTQYIGDWQKGNTYKNISVEGLGQVVIRGPKDSAAASHLLFLRGDHIYVKNVKLRKGKMIGLLMSGDVNRHCHDIKIDGVDSDSTGSFGILIKNGDRIEISNAKIMYASQYGNEGLGLGCQWPSGLKLLGCSHFKVHDTEVGMSRGEGLNYQNSILGEAFRNYLHDNSVNFYNENSKNIAFYGNYLFNTPEGQSKYWRSCPADTSTKRTPCGILIANEGSCQNSVVGSTFENCKTKCIIAGGNEYFSNVDSIFIFNNILQNVGAPIDFWEGSTQILGVNCIKNVFYYHNTSIGYLGPKNSQQPLVNAHFSYYNPIFNTYSKLENVRIWNNIFSVDKTYYSGLRGYLPNFANGHPSKDVIDFSGNLWNYSFSNKTANDTVNSAMPNALNLVTLGNFNAFVPSPSNIAMRKMASAGNLKPTRDFYGKLRNNSTNVGAMEYDANVTTSSMPRKNPFTIYPNPVKEKFQILGYSETIELYDVHGRKISEITPVDGIYLIPDQVVTGLYFLVELGNSIHATMIQVERIY